MKNYNVYSDHTDLNFEKRNLNNIDFFNTDIKILNHIENNNIYKTIFFNNLLNKNKIVEILTKEINNFFYILNIKKEAHILVVGLGNINYTADSVGPKTLKYIKVNSYFENINIHIEGPKVSTLEPKVLGNTGILSEKVIKSVVDEIKPNLVILIDSFVTNNINYLNKTIEITNNGIYPGLGIFGFNNKIDKNMLGIPVLVIGVTTCLEIKFKENNTLYMLSSKDIDNYINTISKVIAISINKSINDLY